VIAFVIGSLILIDTEHPDYGLSLPLISVVSLGSAVLLMFTIGLAIKSHRKPVVSGREEMLNSEGQVVDDFTREGRVLVHGEVWRAHSEHPLSKNQKVRVTGRRGLILDVTPLDEEEKQS
jgi:membrane-bound serine protease (ClpP class)